MKGAIVGYFIGFFVLMIILTLWCLKSAKYKKQKKRTDTISAEEEVIMQEGGGFSIPKITPIIFTCPNCGANLKSTKCEYCGTEIRIINY